MNKAVLILYTEIAGYTLACLNEFCNSHPEIEIHLVRWPVNSEAPFNFVFNKSIKVYGRKDFNLQGLNELAKKINPSAILCSGWIDKDYVEVCKVWKTKIPVVLVMDNKWTGSLKQQLVKLTSSFSVLKWFNYAWVPGKTQKEYALKLGFGEKNIRTGFYSADVSFFNCVYKESKNEKSKKFPHRFIFVGRYYDFKGVNELWSAFSTFKSKSKNDWKLWCLGTGDRVPAEHPAIKHLGFVQQSEMPAVMKQCGVFILPSRVEPWGVAVHEFAAAGFPLLLSDQVGAASAFLEAGKNGFSFPANDSRAIVKTFEAISELPDEKLVKMGEKSLELADSITPARWTATLFELIHSR